MARQRLGGRTTSRALAALTATGLVTGLLAALAPAPVAASHAARPTTTRVSVSTAEQQASGTSDRAVVSRNGRFVVFVSDAADLVPGDTNGTSDIFLRDLRLRTTQRISVGRTGAPADGSSTAPVISGDGRYVAYVSYAANLVPGDTNGVRDVFLHDRTSSTTRRVSVSSTGAQGSRLSHDPTISDDGRYVLFRSVSPLTTEHSFQGAYLRDVVAGTTTLVSLSSDGRPVLPVQNGVLSPDGRSLTFYSEDHQVVPGDTTNGPDLFLRDLDAGTTELVNVSSTGRQADGGVEPNRAALSADGRFVAFSSQSGQLVRGDTNDAFDVFVRDRQERTTTRVSVTSTGAQSDFSTFDAPAISLDGRYVAFTSSATNLVPGDTNFFSDVFVRDRALGTTTRVSVATGGRQGRGDSLDPSISGDGRRVLFMSDAPNLVAGDTNAALDVFLSDRPTG